MVKKGGFAWKGPSGMTVKEAEQWGKDNCPSGYWFGFVAVPEGVSVACQRSRHCCETQMKASGGPKCRVQMFSTGKRPSGGNLNSRRER